MISRLAFISCCSSAASAAASALILALLCGIPPAAAQELQCSSVGPGPAAGAVLLTHGLNQNPDTIAPLGSALRKGGFHVCLLRLAGHSPGDCGDAHAPVRWRGQYSRAYQTVALLYPETPVFAVSFSLGTLLTIDFIKEHQPPLCGSVLFAPPTALRWHASLIRLLLPLRALNVTLPSIAPELYRACPGTSLRAYHRAVSLIDSVQTVNPAVQSVPTLLFLRPTDNIADIDGVRRWLEANRLKRWTLHQVPPAPSENDLPPHLIIDQASLGVTGWSAVKGAMLDFLHSTSRSCSELEIDDRHE